MKDSILNGKSILAVNEDRKVLAGLKKEVMETCPNCTFDTATTFKEATERLASFTYHGIILDIRADCGFDLLTRAVIKKIPVAMLTVHPFDFEALKRSFATKAISPLPKEKLGEVVPLLEGALFQKHVPHSKRPAGKLRAPFQARISPKWKYLSGLNRRLVKAGVK